MPRKIDPEIKPRESDYKALRADGIPPEFVDWELKNFVEYWVERGENGDREAKKAAWFTALRRWMRLGFQGRAGSEFERNKERILMNRPKTRQHCDLFEDVLGGLLAQDKPAPVNHKPRYRFNPPPASGERMSADEALEQLRKFRQGNG